MKDHLKKAYEGKYAVGAFVIFDYDDIRSVVYAAEKMNQSSVIIMTTEDVAENLHPEYIVNYINRLQQDTNIELIVHLDHGKDEDFIHRCVEAGYTSIMYDGSDHSYEENIAITRRIADYCHEHDVLVEGELGQLIGKEENAADSDRSKFTDPDTVPDFVEKTGVDVLAVSIGNAHGFYKGKPEIRFDILKQITENCSVPLVMHGGTGIPIEDLRKAVSMGVVKINVGTALKFAHLDCERSFMPEPDNSKVSITKKSRAIRKAVQPVVEEYMEALGTK